MRGGTGVSGTTAQPSCGCQDQSTGFLAASEEEFIIGARLATRYQDARQIRRLRERPRRARRLRSAASQIGWPVYHGSVSEPGFAVRAEDQPAWAEVVRRAERGESVAVIAHGDHVADVVPSGELDRLRETIEVLSDTELVRDLHEGLADARAGRVFSAGQVAADLAARRVADE